MPFLFGTCFILVRQPKYDVLDGQERLTNHRPRLPPDPILPGQLVE